MKNISKNFEALYLSANASQLEQGMSWYFTAHAIAKRLYEAYSAQGVTLRQVCGVISALSPNNAWTRNIIDAEILLNAFTSGLTMNDVKVCTFNTNKAKAWSILEGQDAETVITANKTLNFFLNIFVPSERYVCVDGHMLNAGVYGFTRKPLSAVKSTPNTKLTDKTYYGWADVIATLAHKYDILPQQMQAVIWTVYRDLVVQPK